MAVRENEGHRFHSIVMNLIRALLVIAFFGAIYNHRLLVTFISALAFFVTFLPWILFRLWKIKIPSEFEIIVLFFIYGNLFFGEVRGFYAQFWWWDVLLNLVAAFVLGLVGITILYALYRNESINASPLVIAFFAFSFAVAMGTLWEIFEFSLDTFFGFNLQAGSLFDTMTDLIVNVIGAFFVSLFGYFYVKTGKLVFVSTLITKFIEMNPKIFGKPKKNDSVDEVNRLIKKGESAELEFKATLRMNLHTQEIDSKVEHATLKTLVAFMNSDGGNLLVGVSDDGRIYGVDKDNFQSNDKLGLHFTNLIKHHIGSEYLPYISFEIVEIEGKHVLFVKCKSSEKEVFLKFDKEEEFYVRNGPSSVRLSGSELVNYIKNRFS